MKMMLHAKMVSRVTLILKSDTISLRQFQGPFTGEHLYEWAIGNQSTVKPHGMLCIEISFWIEEGRKI